MFLVKTQISVPNVFLMSTAQEVQRKITHSKGKWSPCAGTEIGYSGRGLGKLLNILENTACWTDGSVCVEHNLQQQETASV